MSYLILCLCFGGSIRDLGHDDYLVREAAQARLERHSWLTHGLLDRRFLDPEVQRRARQVVSEARSFEPRPLTDFMVISMKEWMNEVGYAKYQMNRPSPEYILTWAAMARKPSVVEYQYHSRPYLRNLLLYHIFIRPYEGWHMWLGDWIETSTARQATGRITGWLMRRGVPPRLLQRILGERN